jgi:hypothetical protein
MCRIVGCEPNRGILITGLDPSRSPLRNRVPRTTAGRRIPSSDQVAWFRARVPVRLLDASRGDLGNAVV